MASMGVFGNGGNGCWLLLATEAANKAEAAEKPEIKDKPHTAASFRM